MGESEGGRETKGRLGEGESPPSPLPSFATFYRPILSLRSCAPSACMRGPHRRLSHCAAAPPSLSPAARSRALAAVAAAAAAAALVPNHSSRSVHCCFGNWQDSCDCLPDGPPEQDSCACLAD